VQSVVRNHGGQLQLSCVPNKGCTVSLVFPRAKSAVILPLEITHV
ncbi:MAG: PAS domain-containing sensor histidine kinase, partial [Shewanella oncorhynchi]